MLNAIMLGVIILIVTAPSIRHLRIVGKKTFSSISMQISIQIFDFMPTPLFAKSS